MTLDQKFAHACEPGRWKILGKRLEPLSVGHFDLIQRIGIFEGEISRIELIEAVRVCSIDLQSAKKYLLCGGWSIWSIWATIAMTLRPVIFETARELFSGYVSEAQQLPNFWSDPKQTRTSDCPLTLMLLRDLPSRYSEDEILAMPFAKAHWLRFAEIEKAGALDFIEDELLERAREMARQVAEEEAAKNGR